MTLAYSEHPEATAELLDTIRYYHEQRDGLGDDFNAEVRAAVRDIREWPDSWPPFPGWSREPQVRSRRVAAFPYRAVYFVRGDEVVIVAYAHERRRPGYWQHRVQG